MITFRKDLCAIINNSLIYKYTLSGQYLLNAEVYNHWGFQKLYSMVKHQSVKKIKHADMLIKRSLLMGCVPILSRIEQIRAGGTLLEHFYFNLSIESLSITNLDKGLFTSQVQRDKNTFILLGAISKEDNLFCDWLKYQIFLISRVGEKNYLIKYG
jgi:bacterioferritin